MKAETRQIGNWFEWWRNIRLFAAVVRSPGPVRHAFDGNRTLTLWWTAVLRLHGKPTCTMGSPVSRCACIATGFRFYGFLYRALAIVFLVAGGLIYTCHLADPYYSFSLILAGTYLWIITGLAFSGAVEFLRTQGGQVWHLVAFLFLLTLFLSGVVTAASLSAHVAGLLPTVANLVLANCALLFGVGSYMIELAALVTGWYLCEAEMH